MAATSKKKHFGVRCFFLLVAAIIFGAVLNYPVSSVAQNLDGHEIDPSVRPGDDFYRYANGGWLKTTTLPAGRPVFNTRTMLAEKTAQRVRDLIRESGATKSPHGSVSQKVGDFYTAFMDRNAIESAGLKPLAGELAIIAAIADK